tara:strand:- start:240 stop:389 length:150 start_codon:yes stop_codon:yes gene_type:complete
MYASVAERHKAFALILAQYQQSSKRRVRTFLSEEFFFIYPFVLEEYFID